MRPSLPFRLLVALTGTAAWALVAVGGLVRVSRSGLGCPDWPLCGGSVVPAGDKEPIIEFSHRFTASTVSVLLLVSVVWALARYRSNRNVTVPLVVALVMVPFQALLGAVVVWLELPGRIVGLHFMVGLVFLATIVYGATAAWRSDTPVSASYRRVALWATGAGTLLVSLGATVVATGAMHACGQEWPLCNGGVATGDRLAVLQVVHRSVGYAVFALALWLLVLTLRGGGPVLPGVAPAAIALVQIGMGVGIVLSGHETTMHDAFRVLHVAGSGAAWAALVTAFTVSVLPPLGTTESRAGRHLALAPER